jgi:hypothetical protein
MALDTSYIYPTELTGYVRQALYDFNVNKFTLTSWLPDDHIDDIDYRIAAGGTGLADAGVYRAYDAETPIGKRQPLSFLSGQLPPISSKARLGEYDRLKLRQSNNEQIRQALFNDAEVQAMAIAARTEIARGQTLVTATTPLPELGLTINWGRTGAHSVTAATLWSNPAADILSDLMAWRDTYLATNGVDPESLVVSRKIWNFMMRNQAIRNQVFGGTAQYVGGNQSSIVNQAALNTLLGSQGLPAVTMYQSQVRVNGAPVKVIPDNIALYLPAPASAPGDTQLGATLWGTTAESLDPRYELEGDEPGIVAGVYAEDDPMGIWTKAAAINLPVMANPNLSFAATVA